MAKHVCWICKDTGWKNPTGWHLMSPCDCAKGREEKAERARRMELRLAGEHAAYQMLAELDGTATQEQVS